MVNASYATVTNRTASAPAYDEQIIARSGERVQRQPSTWFPADAVDASEAESWSMPTWLTTNKKKRSFTID